MSVSALLDDCEKLTYVERKKYMVNCGQRSKTTLETQRSIGELYNGSLYQKFLALETCHGSHDVALALRALSVPSRLLRKRAIVIILLLGTDSELLMAIKSLPLHLQIYAIRKLRMFRRRRRRPQVIDQFLEDLKVNPEKSKVFRRLLPYGSRNLVDQYLPNVIDLLSTTDWSRMATFHPEITEETLHAWALHLKDEDPRLVVVANQTISQWAAFEETSDMALDLVKVMQNSTSLDRLSLSEVVRRRPQQVVDLVLATEDKVQIAVQLEAGTLRGLPVQQLIALQERYKEAVVQNNFPLLMAEQRRAIFPLVRESWSSDDGIISTDIISVLPAELRVSEARRHIKLRIYEEKPSDRIPYISLLPWEEAFGLQTPYLRSKEADIRSSAIYWQLVSVKYDDSHLPDALQLAIKRQHEQSPVRDTMLKGLSEIPAGRWKEIHLLDLEQIMRQALDAGDLSSTSIDHMQTMLAGIIAFHPQWAARQIALIVKERGWITMTSSARLAGVIPVKETMDILNTELSPLFEIPLKKKDALALVYLARRFSFSGINHIRNTREWPGLLDTLEKFLEIYDADQNEAYSHPAYMIIDILKENRPKTWWRRIPGWIEKKSYLMRLPCVLEYIHIHQQNHLLPYLDRTLVFRSNLNPLNDLQNGFERWTHSQQERFATRLGEDIENDEITSDKKQNRIKQLGLLPFIDPYHLISLANNDTPIVREAALRALGRLDSDQGVPTLIVALADERARIAIYSLRTTFMSMSKNEALKMLQSIPMTNVTVAKEVVRLIGDLETDEAFQSLLEIEQTKLHADVRMALFRAVWSYLDREESWNLFTRAAQDPNPEIAKAVLDIPQDGMSSNSRQSFLQALLLLLEHPSVEVRIETLQKCSNLPLQDPKNNFVPRLLQLLQSHTKTELDSAANVVFKTYSKAQPKLIGNLFREALKDRRIISILHEGYLNNVSPSNLRYMDATTHYVLSILKTDRLSGSLRLKLMFGGLPFGDIRELLLEIIPKLHADNVGLAESLIQNSVQNWDGAATEEFELELAVNKDERARRLALELLCSSVKNGGSWTDERRKRLEGYRKDESVLVAEAAWNETLLEKES